MTQTKLQTIGQRVASLRQKRGLSQLELQRRLPSVNIWRVENDQYSPSIAVIERIAQELDATVDLVPKKKKK